VRPALPLFCYALAVAWCVPPCLARLTSRGVSAPLGLAAWLCAMGSALAAAGLAIQFLFRTMGADWPSLTRALCRSAAGNACTPVVYRSALYELGVAAVALAVTAAAALALWRYGRRVQRAGRRSREHARVARIAGRALPGTGALVLDDLRPAAYCVPGRTLARTGPIVVTSGALAVLDATQLAAVLAHERAHLAARHHAIVTATRALTAAFPAVPLFTAGAAEVARLTEMSADDAAARHAGRGPLAAALVAIATATPVPTAALAPPNPQYPSNPQHPPNPQYPPHTPSSPSGPPHTSQISLGSGVPGSLAAAGYAVPARVERMLRPPARPLLRAAVGLGLAAMLAALILLPAVLAVTG
jgi:Zn-dependent protease with chaperone function